MFLFMQSCFIRKNTKYLRDKLEELGYSYNGKSSTQDELTCLYCCLSGYYECTEIPGRFESPIDCGTNEDLFLAIAALRDDTDKNQWFVIPKIKTIRLPGYFGQTIGMDGHQQIIDGYEWYLSDEDGISKKVQSYIKDGEDEKFLPHKATVKELIEHFK